MNKYCVVIGDNPELSRKVQEELFKAGFEWVAGGVCVINTESPVIFMNVTGYCEIHHRMKSQTIGVSDDVNNCIILTPSDILNGGAMELDGAKKVEPRYFLGKNSLDVVELVGNKPKYMGLHDGCTYCTHSVDDLENGGYHIELTAEDVAYITDNAEKAKGLGYEFRKVKKGDRYLGSFTGMECDAGYEESHYDSLCAGYRYCKKADSATYCHQCGEPVTPADSNYCRHCRAKLEK